MPGLKSWTTASLVVISAFVTLAAQGGQGRGRGGQPGTAIQHGEECPPGMTEVRPGRCQAPEKPPPSIVDYRPKSTVVAAEHLVPKAKFPVVDIHNHTGVNADNVAQLIKDMDALNLRVMVNLSGGSGDRLRHRCESIRDSPYKDRFRLFANVNWNGAGTAEWRQKEVAALRQAVADGAIGLKVFKGSDSRTPRPTGSRLHDRRPRSRSDLAGCARELNIPVFIHTADPEQFFAPLDIPQRAVARDGDLPGPCVSAGPVSVFRELWASATACSRAIRRRATSRRTSAGTATTSAAPRGCSTRCRTSISRSARCCTSLAVSRARRASSSSSIRTA